MTKGWDVWIHNGVDRQGRQVPFTRIDQGDTQPPCICLDRGEHQLHNASEAFAFAYAHPEPAILVVCSPEGDCTFVNITSSSRSIPYRGGPSHVPEGFVHGN